MASFVMTMSNKNRQCFEYFVVHFEEGRQYQDNDAKFACFKLTMFAIWKQRIVVRADLVPYVCTRRYRVNKQWLY